MSRPYYIRLGESHCADCGKKIKKVYVLLSNKQEYGSECIKKHVGDLVSDEELGLPAWLLEVAEGYIKYRVQKAAEKGWTIEDGDDFTINFYNEDSESFGATMVLRDKDGTPKLGNGKPIKINGKTVKRAWITGLYYYLLQRREELESLTSMSKEPLSSDRVRVITDPASFNGLLVIGDDEAKLYPHGGLIIRG